MKFQYVFICFLVSLMLSCGSSDRVIMTDGKVYEVKGNSIKNDGTDVTETLSKDRKFEIAATLKANNKAKAEAEQLQESLKAQQKELKKTKEEAEAKQEKLENQQEALEKKIEDKEDARKDFLKAKKRLDNQQKKFEKLKEKGKLSANDEEKWSKKLDDLEKEFEKAKEKMNNLNK
ncbi:hypothetical protein H7F37_10770 [Winogradskyella sp. PAMC22761]|nr:hypothetical protein H7F37_10770 [Winogradskyella sp. PAMC22761]